MHWRTRHPDDPNRLATYGHDAVRGLWAELNDGGVHVAFDQVGLGLDLDDTVLAIIGVLVEDGYVGDWQNVEDAVGVRWIERRRGRRRRSPPGGCGRRCGSSGTSGR